MSKTKQTVFIVMNTIDEKVESAHYTKVGAIERIKKLLKDGSDPTTYQYVKKTVED